MQSFAAKDVASGGHAAPANRFFGALGARRLGHVSDFPYRDFGGILVVLSVRRVVQSQTYIISGTQAAHAKHRQPLQSGTARR